MGWHRSVQFRRLHLIGNNTRFLILPEAQGIRNLASRVLGRSLRRVSADWEAGYGHPLELAETLRAIVDIHGADYLFTVKGNCPETGAALSALHWDAPGVRHHSAPQRRATGA